jgi:hypothetical protein
MVLHMRRTTFPAGATILQQGAAPDAGSSLYVLLRGSAEVVITGAVADTNRAGAAAATPLCGRAACGCAAWLCGGLLFCVCTR